MLLSIGIHLRDSVTQALVKCGTDVVLRLLETRPDRLHNVHIMCTQMSRLNCPAYDHVYIHTHITLY